MSLVMNPETIHLIAGWVLRDDQIFRILERKNLAYNKNHPLSAFHELLEQPAWAELHVRAVYCLLELFCDLMPGEPSLCMLIAHEAPEHRLPVGAPRAPIGIVAEDLAFDNLDEKTRQSAMVIHKKIQEDLGAGTDESDSDTEKAPSWFDIPWKITQDTEEMSSWYSTYGRAGVRSLYEVDPDVSNAELEAWADRMLREGTPSGSEEEDQE